jgi:glycosyltransferase involved in cell wall biosynthesis
MSIDTPKAPILVVLTESWGGGAEAVAAQLGTTLNGGQVAAAVFRDGRQVNYPRGLRSLEVGKLWGEPPPAYVHRLLRGGYRLRRFQTELGAQTVAGFTTWPNLLAIASASRTARVVATVHTIESIGIRGRSAPVVRELVRRAYPRADSIVAVSQGIAEDLQENFSVPASKIRVVYNPVDVSSIAFRAEEPLSPDLEAWCSQRRTLVQIGSHGTAKGLDSLLRVFSEVKAKSKTPAGLLLAGAGPLTESLYGLARALGLRVTRRDRGEPIESASDVVFLGFWKNPYQLARERVFVMPSRWEGLPVALIEALAAGASVIAADCLSGPREILAPGTGARRALIGPESARYGTLVPPPPAEDFERRELLGSEQAWFDVLCAALEHPRKCPEGLARALEFDVDAVRGAWEEALTTG